MKTCVLHEWWCDGHYDCPGGMDEMDCGKHVSGLPQSGKNDFFPGHGKVREFCGWPGKFRKNLESQGKVREFENKWLWQIVFRKFI